MLSQPVDLLSCKIDLPRLPFSDLPTGKKAFGQIIKDDLGGDTEGGGGSLDRIGAIRPLRRVCADWVELDRWQPPPLSQHPDVLVGEGALAGGDDTFLIQYRGDLLIHQALSVELYNAVAKIVEIGVVVVVAVNAPHIRCSLTAPVCQMILTHT